MATPTYTPIASITLGSSASSVTFSSIPQDYRDLVLVSDFTVTAAGVVRYRFNSDATSNYSSVRMYYEGNSAAIGSDSGSGDSLFRNWSVNGTANPNNIIVNVQDYSATDKHKTALARLNDITNTAVAAFAGRWQNTTAITSIEVLHVNAFDTGSTFALYGIEA